MVTLLSATQKQKERSDGHRSKFYLSVIQVDTLLSATIDNALIERGAVSIDFDAGTAADVALIQAGMTCRFTLNGRYFSTTVVSFSSSGSSPNITGTITVHANSIAWADGGTVEILDFYEPRAIPPTFDAGTGISKKRGETWSNQTLPAGIPPVCRMGTHRAGFLPSTPEGTVEATVSDGADDGYFIGAGSFSSTSTSIYIGEVISTPTYVWLRMFLPVPQGAVIQSAYLEFTPTDIPGTGSVTATIKGENADNPAAPVSIPDYQGRTRTTATVSWTPGAWTAGVPAQSADFKDVIQEIVSRPGYAENNAVQLFIEDDSSAGGAARRFVTFNGDPAQAPVLHVTYTLPVSVSFDVDLTNSQAMAPGASISSYNLTVSPDTGATVTENSAGDYTIEFTSTGQYWLNGTATDSNSNSHTTHRRAFIHSQDPDNADYPYVDFTVSPVGVSWDGSVTAEFAVTGVADFSQFIDGALVLLWREDWFGEDKEYISLITGGENILFYGYLLADTSEQDWNNGTVSFRAGNIIETLKNLGMQGLSIHAENAPAYWFQYDHRLTIARALHWLWYWHSTLFEVAEVVLPSNSLYKKLFKFNDGNLFSQAQDLANSIFANVTANLAGVLYVEQNIQMLDAAGRAAVSELTELTSADWRERLTLPRRHKKQQAGVKLRGYHFDGQTLAPYCSVAPSKLRDDSGDGIPAYDGIVVDGQARANMYSGRLQAIANNEEPEERLGMAGNYAVIDVVPQYWLTQDIAAADTPRGLEWTDKRLVPRQVTHTIDVVNGLLTTDIVVEPEITGPDGVSDVCPEVPDATIENPPWVGVEPALGALVAFSSANYRDDNATDWTEQDAGGATGGCKDVWWPLRQGSTNPQDAILLRVNGGEIHRSLDAGITWEDVTPAEDPPDTWAGSTAPGIELSTFVEIFPDAWTRGRFFTLEYQQIDSLWQGWLTVTPDDGATWERVELYDGVTLPAGVKPIWLDVNGSYILVAVWVDAVTDILRLLAFDAATLAYVDEWDLGAATEAEVFTSKAIIAYPRTVLDDDDTWYIFGRMNAPQSLANPEHVIKTANAGTNWASVANGFGTKHVATLEVSLLDGTDRTFTLGVHV